MLFVHGVGRGCSHVVLFHCDLSISYGGICLNDVVLLGLCYELMFSSKSGIKEEKMQY